METQQIKELILKELPTLMQQDSGLREWVLNIGRTQFADKAVTESRFDQMMRVIQQQMEEDRQSRERQARRWEENQQQLLELERKSDERWEEIQSEWKENQRKWEENQRKWEENQQRLLELERKSDERWKENQRQWEENQRKWEENQQVINEMLKSIRNLDKKYDQTLGALGTRWGLHSEDTFRNALSGILQEFPSGVEVIHVNEFDDAGEVFGRPDQVELDLIIRNGKLLIAEIKSSMSRGEMYLFERKARFYERRHQRTAHRLIVISPMVDKRAQEVAAKLGITVYSYTDEVNLTD
ncbi:hypothetical protein THII_1155 [Thioploca ingrica]|uniref:DUF3782 domain-containing protein n=1 Tax=Thioploca ingrica TaxID=40754 RepID=A0A090AIY7_9GAMM|nr:hypothetical protein THII_1155 [Thioploca ingrica]